jgi:hypothetical protein|tara:strand:+ start:3891 stop:5876 length:1986 start_codon:yes stop_codon:yes gene_type:complete
MAVTGSSTNANGDQLLVSLKTPYENVVEVLSFTDSITGETTACYYNKDFRWGIDGVQYSDWVTLTDANLKALILNPANKFWIQYRYTQVGDCTLTFNSIALEIVYDGGVICKIPQIDCGGVDGCSGALNLAFDCCGDTWNPYDISRAGQMYTQLSAMASNLFGFCVDYYKTKADQRSRDVILKEYSLFDVIKEGEIKIMIPDNELPTRDINFNPLMMDFPVQFEIHIVKSAFEAVFGIGSKPQMRDYLYFKQFMNRMYEVDAIAEADDFMYTGSYWRVSLVTYQQRTNVGFEDTVLGDAAEASTKALVSNVEDKFRVERENEFKDVRKPNEYNTIGSQTNDYVRRALNKKMTITEENVYNQWTIISKYHYSLGTLAKGAIGVKYRYTGGWAETDNRAFTFWFRPQYKKPIGKNVLITQISNNAGFPMITTPGLPIGGTEGIIAGDWIAVRGTTSYNGIQLVKSIDVATKTLTLDTPYIDSTRSITAKLNKEVSNTIIQYDDYERRTPITSHVQFTYTTNWFIIKLNDVYYKYDLSKSTVSFLKGKWYAAVINLNQLAKQLSLFLYNTPEIAGAINPNKSADLTNIYINTQTVPAISVPEGYAWKLLGCESDLTNIRIWSEPIEIELQELILSQYVVKDSHLALLLDNASPELLLPTATNPR